MINLILSRYCTCYCEKTEWWEFLKVCGCYLLNTIGVLVFICVVTLCIVIATWFIRKVYLRCKYNIHPHLKDAEHVPYSTPLRENSKDRSDVCCRPYSIIFSDEDVKVCIKGILIGMEQALCRYCGENTNDKIKSMEMLKFQEGLICLKRYAARVNRICGSNTSEYIKILNECLDSMADKSAKDIKKNFNKAKEGIEEKLK